MSSQHSHELVRFKECTFGDGGFYYHDNADRAVCSCGWVSAASQNKPALVALFEVHAKREDAKRTSGIIDVNTASPKGIE